LIYGKPNISSCTNLISPMVHIWYM
jgi:hypothetical protein